MGLLVYACVACGLHFARGDFVMGALTRRRGVRRSTTGLNGERTTDTAQRNRERPNERTAHRPAIRDEASFDRVTVTKAESSFDRRSFSTPAYQLANGLLLVRLTLLRD